MPSNNLPLSLLSGNPLLIGMTAAQVARIESGEWYHSIELLSGEVIPGIIPVSSLKRRFDRLGVPEDLTGLRVLDVGAATGWCSFEMERRGAKVVAVDCVEYEDFRTAHSLLNSKVEYLIMDMEEISRECLGKFDLVLFLGVLYHLRHPLLALERILSVADDRVFVESFVCDARLSETERELNGCYMEFYETTELAGQLDNWVGPNTNCLLAFCRSAGFCSAELRYVEDNRAGVACRRKLVLRSSGADLEAPVVSSAVNNRSGDAIFHRGKDEYLCVYFRAPSEHLSAGQVEVEVGGLGVPVLTVTSHEESVWQANLRLPTDIEAGPQVLRVRLPGGNFSESVSIYIDCLPPVDAPRVLDVDSSPELYRATNGLSQSSEFFGRRSDYLCCCFYFSAEVLRTEDVQIEIGNQTLVPMFVGRGDGWQANVKLPKDLPAGTYDVSVRVAKLAVSNALSITVNEVRVS